MTLGSRHDREQHRRTRPSPPYPRNAPGDFYVENDRCMGCEAPYYEAPDLMAHYEEADYPHCYFKKQPETPEEVERAIMACYVSCVRAVRYGRRNPKILKKFQELGRVDSCDVFSPDEDKALPLILREKLERLRGAEDEPQGVPISRPDHPLYDRDFGG
jgi:hypothetical protein